MSQSAEDADQAKTEPELHPYHRHGDIRLLSKDNILFCVDGWRLAHASTVFKDMLQLPQPVTALEGCSEAEDIKSSAGDDTTITSTPPHTAGDPISVDTKASVLDIFVNMASTSDPEMFSAGGLSDMKDLFILADKYDCKAIHTGLLNRAKELGKTKPWHLLYLASEMDNRSLGAWAVGSMDTDFFINGDPMLRPMTYGGNGQVHSGFRATLRHLRPEWQDIFLRALITNEPERVNVTREHSEWVDGKNGGIRTYRSSREEWIFTVPTGWLERVHTQLQG